MAIDPVCKMEVEESKAAATSEYKGKKYYFCDILLIKAQILTAYATLVTYSQQRVL